MLDTGSMVRNRRLIRFGLANLIDDGIEFRSIGAMINANCVAPMYITNFDRAIFIVQL